VCIYLKTEGERDLWGIVVARGSGISIEKLLEFLHTLSHKFSPRPRTECKICKFVLSGLNLEHIFFNGT